MNIIGYSNQYAKAAHTNSGHGITVKALIHSTQVQINPLKTKSRLLYLKTQVVPRSKHFSSRL